MWCVAAFLVGCGSVSGHPDASTETPTADAAPTSDATVGSDAAATTCDPASKFDAPVPLAGFMTAADETSVSLSPDELTVYLSSNKDTATTNSAHDIYIAQRPTLSDPFSGLTPLTAVNAPVGGTGGVEDYDATISADGKTLIWSSNRTPNEGYHLYVATRSSTLAAFSTPALVMASRRPTSPITMSSLRSPPMARSSGSRPTAAATTTCFTRPSSTDRSPT